MHSLTNDIISIQVSAKGAELQSIFNKQNNLEYMWGAGPEWPKRSPVLFPIVGGLKDNKYTYQGAEYSLSRHGFAREKDFDLTDQTSNSITFSLKSTSETLKVYPFEFTFMVRYTLHDNSLEVTYIVMNNGSEDMLFSVGAHPAFKVPLSDGTTYEDYTLLFKNAETTGRWPLSSDGLIESSPTPLLTNSNLLPLTKNLFANDAIVLKDLQSTAISIVSNKTAHGLKMKFDGFPYMGIWAAKGADFVCIEPWCGIADSVDTNDRLEDKEGINSITAGEVFERSFTVEVF